MEHPAFDIEILSAPSILGLKPTGVEDLGKSLLDAGLAEKVTTQHPVIEIPTLNVLYDPQKDPETHCLNARAIKAFSLTLSKALTRTLDKNRFALVLGGDCSILIGIMTALRAKGKYGLIFIDAHADFYAPRQSPTGEVADMDLAIVTGRGPEILTNIHDLRPYVQDQNVVHIGQRDQEETKRYGSADIRETAMRCFDLPDIEKRGIEGVAGDVERHIGQLGMEGFWIHFDTDVLSDKINPAVDYRLPGGLLFEQMEFLLQKLFGTGKIRGMSVTIFNPALDQDRQIAWNITESLERAFNT